MSVYKEPVEWIKESIESILNQTFSDFEFIIINDNPDRIENDHVLKYYGQVDSRIKLIKNTNNLGLTKSLNIGLSVSTGEYVARMDADDISKPQRFEMQINYLDQHEEVSICGCNRESFGADNSISDLPIEHENMYFFINNYITHSSVMFRKSLVRDRMFYDETYRYAQDYALWSRLYCNGFIFHNLESPLLKYRISSIQALSTAKDKQDDVARKCRRRCLDYYLESNGYDFKLGDDDISEAFIIKIMDGINIPQKYRSELLYMILLSFKGSLIRIIYIMLKYYGLLSLENMIKIFYHSIRKTSISQY